MASVNTSVRANRAENDDQKLDAVLQIGDPHGITEIPRGQVDADGGGHQAQHRGHEPLDGRTLAEGGHREHGEHHQRKILGRPEQQGEVGHDRGQQHQADHRQGAAGKTGDGGDAQGLARFPPKGHGVAVEGRGHHAGDPGGVDEDGRGRPAEDGAVVDAGHEDHAEGRVEVAQHGDHHGDGRNGPRPGRAPIMVPTTQPMVTMASP